MEKPNTQEHWKKTFFFFFFLRVEQKKRKHTIYSPLCFKRLAVWPHSDLALKCDVCEDISVQRELNNALSKRTLRPENDQVLQTTYRGDPTLSRGVNTVHAVQGNFNSLRKFNIHSAPPKTPTASHSIPTSSHYLSPSIALSVAENRSKKKKKKHTSSFLLPSRNDS